VLPAELIGPLRAALIGAASAALHRTVLGACLPSRATAAIPAPPITVRQRPRHPLAITLIDGNRHDVTQLHHGALVGLVANARG
jgi:hypothetical protein